MLFQGHDPRHAATLPRFALIPTDTPSRGQDNDPYEQ
ncbi:MAG: hypothetical protein JWQ95_5642 [Sphaerisporangium sp.]|jgi:hypothetical protein|nr:hypothetical protein [Sphaerisporangium sp.]